MDKINWGIMGTGNIAHTFAKAVIASSTGRLLSVGSRTTEAAERFASEYDIPNRHGSYDSFVTDPGIDVVYISMPNHIHKEWAIRCAEAGKHILCEKPLAVNHAEAVEIVQAVKKHDVFLMEAFMYRCHPQTARLMELVRGGEIGTVKHIQSCFSYNLGPKYENIRMSNSAAGGGIMDVGCYTSSMARLIAGSEPDCITGAGFIGPISHVDEQASASLRFPDGAVASLICGTQVSVDSELRIWGSAGSIRMPNPWFPGEGANTIYLQRAGGPVETISVEGEAGLYTIEADTVARYIDSRQAPSPCMSWADSLGNMATLDAWRRSIGLVFDVERSRSS